MPRSECDGVTWCAFLWLPRPWLTRHPSFCDTPPPRPSKFSYQRTPGALKAKGLTQLRRLSLGTLGEVVNNLQVGLTRRHGCWGVCEWKGGGGSTMHASRGVEIGSVLQRRLATPVAM